MRTKMPKDKVIAYFIKAKNGPLHSNNNRGQTSNSGPEDRKVLVDVGDRCVAPAKSKPKKRKKLKTTGTDGGGGGSPSDGVCIELSPIETTETVKVVWSDDVYTVRHLAKEFDGRLPVIVKIDQGHYREGVVDLARGQVNFEFYNVAVLPVQRYCSRGIANRSAEVRSFQRSVRVGKQRCSLFSTGQLETMRFRLDLKYSVHR